MFFQQVKSLDNDQWRRSFKSYPALDTYDGIAYMYISPYSIRLRYRLQVLYCFHRPCELDIIYSCEFSLFKNQRDILWSCFRHLGRPCSLRQIFAACQRFFAADRSAPQAFIDAVLCLLKVHSHTMLFKKVYLRFAAQLHVAYRCDAFYARYHALKDHIKTHLVVAGTCTAMSYIVCIHFLCILGDRYCLHHPFCTYTKRIDCILQYIAKDKVFDATIVIRLRNINNFEGRHSDLKCTLPDPLQFFITKTACLYSYSVHFKPHYLRKINGAIVGIQTTTIC